MKSPISRRDFLKTAGILPLGMSLAPLLHNSPPRPPAEGAAKNVLVIVFDAFSAYHIPFHGYARNTTPHLARLAERAIVYHNHYASGNFTTPGTASLLTGTLPWTHRAFKLNGTVSEAYARKTIFQAFAGRHRIAYSHNPLVNTLFKQFAPDIDDYVPQTSLFLTADPLVHSVFGADEDIADVGWTRAMKKEPEGYTYSLFLSELYRKYIDHKVAGVASQFGRGIPSIRGDNYFMLEDAIDWLQDELDRQSQPYFAYMHFMPPHAPCTTRKDLYGTFDGDGFEAPPKHRDVFSGRITPPELSRQRLAYDEFVLYLDREFARLFSHMEESGILEDTWVVFTSDHGELFERGVRGHISPLLYEPVVRIPLLIFEPGRTSRLDIRTATSAVDILPTLLHVTGEPSVDWAEGEILPPFADQDADPERSVYALHAKQNDAQEALTHATAALVRGRHKLMYFFGYEELGAGVERVELYDIQSDPEELRDLYGAQREAGDALLASLKEKLRQVNEPYS
jgi:choline-sulfatase